MREAREEGLRAAKTEVDADEAGWEREDTLFCQTG